MTSEIGKRMRQIPKKLPKLIAQEAADDVARVVIDSYPADHVRTGAARDGVRARSYGKYIKLKSGVHKKKSKTGKRRKRRSTKINYAQFLPWLYDHKEKMDAVITQALETVDAL